MESKVLGRIKMAKEGNSCWSIPCDDLTKCFNASLKRFLRPDQLRLSYLSMGVSSIRWEVRRKPELLRLQPGLLT
ncbi:hypothetical protein NPIL_117621 [Nephila pilipes]|uniref:Uncharacterized protein n=1 Tax=Nephila pilipes TaxID=299642 RepID=A0A8X6QUR5_NEPPI|nr:hypothetical protein NPIL_117621 [Nephila pilipes]